ncbi:MAG: glucose-6-phosphate isomerase [Clostridiales bacterium]|nr:glucose-6-phosphate isomerase [Clostridiales bacterium]
MNNILKFDYNNMLSAASQGGFDESQLFDILPMASSALHAIRDLHNNAEKNMVEWMDILSPEDSVVNDVLETARQVSADFDYFVVLGIGGSALGPIAVQKALNHNFYNELPDSKRPGPRFYVLDNIDPTLIGALCDVIDIKRTAFNVITKSGTTTETMSQFIYFKDLLCKEGVEDWTRHFFFTTSKDKGVLFELAREYGIKSFVIPNGTGGRFSVFSPVGLFPAAVCGIDIKGMLTGAQKMKELCLNEDIKSNPAAVFALLQYLAVNSGKNISVLMPYSQQLSSIAEWYCQLWAESLGKKYDKEGNTVNCGQTPVKAVGVTDQHSQLQLYSEGPSDKVITFINVENYGRSVNIPEDYAGVEAMSFLSGVGFDHIAACEQKGTQYALTDSRKLTRSITLSEVNANTVAQLLTFFEFETAFMGELLGINTYDQPGVELSKKATFALLGRKGYETQRKELMRAVHHDKYTI